MHFLVLSTSVRPGSRSERLAKLCSERLTELGESTQFISVKDHMLPGFDDGNLAESETYRYLHEATSEADGLIFASPIYNWGCCGELKKYVEWIGSTPPGGEFRGAFYDKTITFVCAAGVPHSYMAFGSLAVSMMLDYKCIINPYQVYLYDRHWDESGRLIPDAFVKINKAMSVMVEITRCLQSRTYESTWEM